MIADGPSQPPDLVPVFGPVPSRRLGRSLGINNIPPKVCTYGCVYCQVGRTTEWCVSRRAFVAPAALAQAVADRVAAARARAEPIDYLTFVPDGEPTLDVNLGATIELLRPLGLPVAVISNAALVWRDDVRADLMRADWVSLKVDSVREPVWRRINRPHRDLRLDAILEGMRRFGREFGGTLTTETLVVRGLNDGEADAHALGAFLANVRPRVAYLAIPTRPPAERWVEPPPEADLHRLYCLLAARLDRVEYLIGDEGDAFAATGDARRDLLSMTAVHPMRADAVRGVLARSGAAPGLLAELLGTGELVELDYRGERFYARGYHGRRREANDP